MDPAHRPIDQRLMVVQVGLAGYPQTLLNPITSGGSGKLGLVD